MTKISTYVVDEKVTALDKWIGSDANMQNRTKNFTPKKLAAYFNEDQVINIGTPLQYKYYTLDPLEARPNGTLTFETEIGPTVNFSSITTFLLSKYTTKQNIVSDFLNFLDGSKVLLFKSSDINSFGFYRISSLEPYEPDPNFFVVTVSYETGNGALEEDEDYMISLVSLAGDFIPTKTSELINDGDDGVNPFISELDIDRTEWDAAYEGKINSAEVTGDTTKTLTLTKQDGSTIEASWTDKGLDLELTTTGTSGVATLVDSVLNIPDYTIDTSEFVHIEGDEFIYNTKKFYQTDSIVSQLEFNNTRSIDGLASIEMVNTDGASSIDVINSGAGEGVNILNSGEGYGQIITNQDAGFGLLVNNDGSGTSGIGGGIKIIGTSYAPSFTISNSAQGDAIFVNSIGTSSGTPINLQQDGVTNFQVSKLGDVTANKLIKSGGTSSQYLMADGSVSTGPILTGYVPYTGATQDVNLGIYQLKADSLAVSTTSTETVGVGDIVWNAIDGTFDMGLIGGVTLQAGQELHIYGKATEVISNGQAVMFAGVQGDHILISKADAATINSNPEYLIGVATQDFATNDFGYVTVFGNVRGLDTTAYTLGSVLYYNSESTTDGLLTETMPTAPNAKIIVAAVVRVHATQGILLVRPHVMPKLKDIQDVYAPSPSSDNGLFWNSSTLRYENNSIIGALGYTPYNATNPSNYITLGSISSTATGLTYTDTTGVFSLTSGYVIPTTIEESNWNDAYSNRITSASTPLSISSNAISISQAGTSTNGYLTSTDWNTFNNKQVAGNYITSLTGEATASGPGAASVTLNNASVTAKILSGVNITGGTILDTDTMLTAFGKLQNQINSLIGGSIYQGVWNANTNTPTLTSSVGTDGNYYIVNVAGSTDLNGVTDWKVGDWAIFHGGTWQKVDNTDAVSSVNGFTGAVSLTTDNIPEGTTNLYFTDARVSTNTDVAANTASRHNPVTISTSGSINGLNIDVSQQLSISSASSTQNGALSSTDWNTFNNKQSALNGTGFVKISGTTISYDNNTYALDSSVVKLTGNQSIAGWKTFTEGLTLWDNPGNNTLDFYVGGVNVGNLMINSSFFQLTSKSSNGYLFKNSSLSNLLSINDSGTSVFSGSVTAASIAKTGGTSSQFLKADGSVDSTSYQPLLTNPITGSTLLSGNTGDGYVPRASGSTTLTNSNIYDNGTSVGIGTASPLSLSGTNLSIVSAGNVRLQLDSTNDYRIISNTSGDFSIQDSTNSSDKLTITGTGEVRFRNNSAETMRITSGGNVGIGKTSPSEKLDINGNLKLSASDSRIKSGDAVGRGIYSNSDVTSYIITNGSSNPSFPYNIDIVSGSGTSSGNITFYTATNERMRITSGGNVGIGTPSPAAKLDIYNNTAFSLASLVTASDSRVAFRIKGRNTATNTLAVSSNNTTDYILQVVNSDGTSSGNILLNSYGGNVGIGTTSPSTKLHVVGASEVFRLGTTTSTNYFTFFNSAGTQIGDIGYDGRATNTMAIWNNANGGMIFGANAAERIRITSGGFTKISNSGSYRGVSSEYHEIVSNVATQNAIIITNSSATNPYGPWINFSNSSLSGTSTYFLAGSNTAGDKFFIWSNGSIVNATGSYGTISDIKYKENIIDATSKLDDILQLKVRNFNFIGEESKQIGFIAQEFEEVFPNMIDISTERNEDGEEGETYKSIKTSVLTPILVKAMQELAEQVKDLKAEIELLKAK